MKSKNTLLKKATILCTPKQGVTLPPIKLDNIQNIRFTRRGERLLNAHYNHSVQFPKLDLESYRIIIFDEKDPEFAYEIRGIHKEYFLAPEKARAISTDPLVLENGRYVDLHPVFRPFFSLTIKNTPYHNKYGQAWANFVSDETILLKKASMGDFILTYKNSKKLPVVIPSKYSIGFSYQLKSRFRGTHYEITAMDKEYPSKNGKGFERRVEVRERYTND